MEHLSETIFISVTLTPIIPLAMPLSDFILSDFILSSDVEPLLFVDMLPEFIDLPESCDMSM